MKFIKFTSINYKASNTKMKMSDLPLNLGLFSRCKFLSGKMTKLLVWDLTRSSVETRQKVLVCQAPVRVTLGLIIATI